MERNVFSGIPVKMDMFIQYNMGATDVTFLSYTYHCPSVFTHVDSHLTIALTACC